MDTFTRLITDWYRQNKRNLPWRETSDPYLIWISEIILQQTRVDQGINYYLTFKKNYPTISDLANASEESILNDWQGLGYYSRARNLHFSAQFIRDKHDGIFPTDYNEIKALKGVGSYTAAAVSSFAYNQKYAVVDGNVYRLLSRVFSIDTPIDSTEGIKYFQRLANELIDEKDPAIHNQAIMEVGAIICTPKNPNCDDCPLEAKCLAKSNGTFDNLPVKSKKTKVRKRFFHYLIFLENNETIIEKRIEKDIWQHLYQFPMIETDSSLIPESLILKDYVVQSQEITHILSHQKITAKFYNFNKIPKEKESHWIKIKKEDIQDFPLPRIIDRYIESNEF
ncbi:MAG: A/G-specific adenine glycosylase [Crocinitomicaceae bacterium]